MKQILLGLLVVVLLGGITYFDPFGLGEQFAENPEIEEVEEVEEEVSQYPPEVLDAAQEAQNAVLRRFDLEGELSVVQGKISDLEAREAEIEKELDLY